MTREEAIAVLENERPACGEKVIYSEGEKCEAYDMAIEALRLNPDAAREFIDEVIKTAQQERPKGRWEFVELKDHPLYGKPHKVGEWRCPFCGRTVAFKPPYCHCGADMRGEEE